MGKPQIPLEVDDVTGWWTVEALPMILVPEHFFVNNHKAMEAALGVDAYRAGRYPDRFLLSPSTPRQSNGSRPRSAAAPRRGSGR